MKRTKYFVQVEHDLYTGLAVATFNEDGSVTIYPPIANAGGHWTFDTFDDCITLITKSKSTDQFSYASKYDTYAIPQFKLAIYMN